MRHISIFARSVSTTLILFVLSLFLSSPLSAQTPSPDNLLPNPSFEQGAAAPVPGWKSRSWSGADNARWTVASPGRTGRHCLSIQSAKGTDAAWTATVTVQPDTLYRLSGWIKTKDLRDAAGALLNIQNMQQVRTPAITGTRDWTRVSTLFRSGSTTELEINCLFGGWGQSTGQAWYDDVALERIADSPNHELQATLTIDANSPPVPRSPLMFGGFIEHFHRQIYGGIFEPGSPLSDKRGFRKDVIAALKELKLSIVRWPGGCFASGYHWKDGIGPSRKPVHDLAWGVDDPNTFGTEEFVDWCRLVGCEPYICTNAGNGTPQEMRDWVEYCNAIDGPYARLRRENGRIQPLNVRYWSIGNENWGGHEIGAKTPAEWGPLVKQSAELMQSVDPRLTLLAAATPDRNWTLPLLKSAGDRLDLVAIHEYWLPCWGENLTPDYLTCIMHSAGPEATLTRVIALLDESGRRGRTHIAFDEWNLRGWHHPGFPRKQPSDSRDPAVSQLIRNRDKNDIASQYTMADALFSASFLNACLRHAQDVGMTNIAPIVNTRGPLYVHPGGIVKRTTFHTLAMYASELLDHVAHADVESEPLTQANRSIPAVDAIASTDPSRKTWAIALINRHPSKPALCTINLTNTPLQGRYEAIILSADSPEAFNDLAHPTRVAPQRTKLTFTHSVTTLPPHSLTILKIPSTP